MTEQSMFFEDGTWYDQVLFARFPKDIFGVNGVVRGIEDELASDVNTPANMAVKIKTGRAYINGYIYEVVTDPAQVVIESSDPTNPRIDRIVLRLNVNYPRQIRLAVLKGTPGAIPQPPELTQTTTLWEEPLHKVMVRANTLTINANDITDERGYMQFTYTHMYHNSYSGTAEPSNSLGYDGDLYTMYYMDGTVVKVRKIYTKINGVWVQSSSQEGVFPNLVKLSLSPIGGDFLQSTAITNNTSNISNFMGIDYVNKETTETKSASYSVFLGGASVAPASGYATVYAKNIFTGTTRQLSRDEVSSSTGETRSHTATMYLGEILTIHGAGTSGNPFHYSLTSTTIPDVYIVAP